MPLRFPSGPAGAGPFGAYYTRLKYNLSWDQDWRVSHDPDVVVRFEGNGSKLVFWRGTSYIPCWVTENNIWYANEFCETLDAKTTCSQEPLSDRYCLFSHVRIIESTPARVVLHWRYALSDYDNKLAHEDPLTGWHDMADEYYTVYPNCVAMRKIILYSSRLDLWHEFQESLVFNPPGVMPDEPIDPDAVSLANLKGESQTFRWNKTRPPQSDWQGQPQDSCIEVINLKSTYKRFIIVPPDKTRILLLRARGSGGSRFNCWCGPIRQLRPRRPLPAPAESFDQTTHACLSRFVREDNPKDTFGWLPYEQTAQSMTKLMLNGMTSMSASELALLGRSWLQSPQLEILSGSYTSEGYDPTQLAYVLSCQPNGTPSALKVKILCTSDSPLYDPAFVIKDWGQAEAGIAINGVHLPPKEYCVGFSRRLEGTDLIIWVRKECAQPVEIEIVPKGISR